MSEEASDHAQNVERLKELYLKAKRWENKGPHDRFHLETYWETLRVDFRENIPDLAPGEVCVAWIIIYPNGKYFARFRGDDYPTMSLRAFVRAHDFVKHMGITSSTRGDV